VIAKKKAPIPRPSRRAAIDLKVVEGMASVGATNVEIAAFVGVDEALIRRRCAPVLLKARASMRTRLRQAQFRTAMDGNPALLIWLGKQMLDQREKVADALPTSEDTAKAIVAGIAALRAVAA